MPEWGNGGKEWGQISQTPSCPVLQYPALGFYLLNLTESQKAEEPRWLNHKVQPTAQRRKRTIMYGREDSGASSAQEVWRRIRSQCGFSSGSKDRAKTEPCHPDQKSLDCLIIKDNSAMVSRKDCRKRNWKQIDQLGVYGQTKKEQGK